MQSGRKNKKKSVYFLIPAPIGISPGQRFRFEHYLDAMAENGTHIKISSFYSSPGWDIIFKEGHAFRKIVAVIGGFLKRFTDLFRMWGYEYVFIYREAAPLGPPVTEWIIARLLRKKIIYDFDDAIWIPVTTQHNRMARYFKWFGKISKICKWSYKVSVGNDFLAAFSRKYNSNTFILPTVVNTKRGHSHLQDQSTDTPHIGWTGTFSTLKYLEIILPVLEKLQNTFNFKFIVIANKDPKLNLNNYEFRPWKKETEESDLLAFHIGVMPLYDDDISRGKCGFKAIQYMSLGIPAVVSPVGINSTIVDNEVNGYVCDSDEEWENRLKQLLTDMPLRKRMGEEARKKIESSYSVISGQDQFFLLFS